MYKKEINLEDYEIAAKLNVDTGEFIPIESNHRRLPEGKSIQRFKSFSKVNNKAMEFFIKHLKDDEMMVLVKMINRADYETNVMIPLNDDTSYVSLSKEFGIDKRRIKKILDKLFELGVYSEVHVANGINREYWTLNPFISWKGKLIPRDIECFFNKTKIAMYVLLF